MPSKRIGFIVLLVLLALSLITTVVWVLSRPSWEETYNYKKKDPYALSVIYTLLQHRFSGSSFEQVDRSLAVELPSHSTNTAYVFIGQYPYFENSDATALLDFVKKGNEALIIASSIPDDLLEVLLIHAPTMPFIERSQVMLSLRHPAFQQPSDVPIVYKVPIEEGETATYFWHFFKHGIYFNDRDIAVLGWMEHDYPNFIRVRYGKGWFYLHSTPLAFSNNALLDREVLDYASRVFSHLRSEEMLWDQYNHSLHSQTSDSSTSTSRTMDNSPLSYMLNQPPLALAWYILLGSMLFFLIFRTKRRQAAIPVYSKPGDTSLAYLRMIGRLHFLNQDHRRAAIQNFKFFQQLLWERYQIPPHLSESELIPLLHTKTRLPEWELQQLFQAFRAIQAATKISTASLIAFHQQLERTRKAIRAEDPARSESSIKPLT